MIYSRQYKFAGISIRIDSEAPLDEYLGLPVFSEEPGDANFNISVSFAETLPAIPQDGRRWHEFETVADAGQIQRVYAVAGFDDISCCITALDFYSDKLDAAAVLRMANFHHMLLMNSAVVMHASCILHNSQAILFTAPCGVGKSTQADLWAKHRGAEIINGDRAIIRRCGSEFSANGVYYAGTSGICKNASAPVKAIVLLGQAKENRAVRLHGREAFLGIFRQCAYSDKMPEDPALAAEICADAANNVPIIKLDCLPDESAVETLERFL